MNYLLSDLQGSLEVCEITGCKPSTIQSFFEKTITNSNISTLILDLDLSETTTIRNVFSGCGGLNETLYKQAISYWKLSTTSPFLNVNSNNTTSCDTGQGVLSGWQKCANGWLYFANNKWEIVTFAESDTQPDYTP